MNRESISKNKTFIRITTAVIVISMLAGIGLLRPAGVIADWLADPIKEIILFEPLDDETAFQIVPIGTEEGTLNLPATLTAAVIPQAGNAADSVFYIPDLPDEYTGADKPVESDQPSGQDDTADGDDSDDYDQPSDTDDSAGPDESDDSGEPSGQNDTTDMGESNDSNEPSDTGDTTGSGTSNESSVSESGGSDSGSSDSTGSSSSESGSSGSDSSGSSESSSASSNDTAGLNLRNMSDLSLLARIMGVRTVYAAQSGQMLPSAATTADVPVIWLATPQFDGETEGIYIFSPIITGDNFILAEGVTLPQITVMVGEVQGIAALDGNLSTTVTVIFDSNGGTTLDGHGEREVQQDGTVGQFMPIPPTNPNYVFWRWNTKQDGTGTWFQANTVVTPYVVDGKVTVYAIWGFTVEFRGIGVNLNIGTDPNNPAHYITRIVPNIDLHNRTVTDTPGIVWPNDPPVPAGAVRFIGWFDTSIILDEDGTPYQAGNQYTTDTEVNRIVRLYSRFEWRSPYRVDFDPTMGNINTNHTDHRLAIGGVSITNSWHFPHLQNRHVTPAGWGQSVPSIIGPPAARASHLHGWWTRPGGNVNDDGSIIAGALDIANTGTIPADGVLARLRAPQSAVINRDITLYAFWQHQVSFNANGGTLGANSGGRFIPAHIAPQYRNIETSGQTNAVIPTAFRTMPANPVMGTAGVTEYRFAGWSYAPNSTEFPAIMRGITSAEAQARLDDRGRFLPDHQVDANMTVWAVWYSLPGSGVQVTFDLQGGTIAANQFPRGANGNLWTREQDNDIHARITTPIFTRGTSIHTSAVPQVTMPTIPTRPGFVFVGWYPTPGAGQPNGTRFLHTVPVNEDRTVYANWQPYFEVLYNPNSPTAVSWTGGGRTTVAGTNRLHRIAEGRTINFMTTVWNNSGHGNAYSLPSVFRSGYNNNSWNSAWNTEEDGSGTLFNANTVVDRDQTVYMQWTPFIPPPPPPVNRTVTFHSNRASFVPLAADTTQSRTVRHDYSILNNHPDLAAINHTMPNSPTVWPGIHPAEMPGWSFVGWNANAQGTGAWFTGTEIITANRTVFAIWHHGISFNAGARPQVIDEEHRTRPFTSANIGQPLANFPPDPTWEGHRFAGWFATSSGIARGARIDASTPIFQSNTLYAAWYVDVTFSPNGGVLTDLPRVGLLALNTLGQHALYPTQPVRTNWNFAGWFDAATGGNLYTATTPIMSNTDLFAQWEGIVTFKPEGGTISGYTTYPQRTVREAASVGSANMPPEPTRTGYEFTGWRTAPAGGTSFNENTPMTTGHKNVYAQWTPRSVVTVTFDSNGGTAVVPPTRDVLPGQTLANNSLGSTMPGDPERTGYTFEGWNTVQGGGGTAFTATTPIPANITVYAQWTALGVVTVTFDSNGGTAIVPPTRDVLAGQTLANNSLGSTMPGDPTRTDYTFASWNTEQDGSGTVFTATTPIPANITVYAQWTALGMVTVTFDSNGGTAIVPPGRDVLYGQSLANNSLGSTMPGDPERVNYTFANWNTAQDGSGTVFTATTPVTSNIIVFAQWTAIDPVTVTFDSNGGTAVVPPTRDVLPGQTLASNTLGSTMPGDPTRTGYTFEGWNTAQDGSGTAFTATTPVTGNIIVFAQWTAIDGGGGSGGGGTGGGSGSGGSGGGTGGGSGSGNVPPPPLPSAPDNVVVQSEEGDYFIEFTPAGTPLGHWVYNEETGEQEFIEFGEESIPLAALRVNPQTGDDWGFIFLIVSLAGLVASLTVVFVIKRRNKQKNYK